MTDHFKTMNESDWGTPPAITAAARLFQGRIDLDPASSESRNAVVGAAAWLGLPHVDPEIGIPCDWGTARHIFINPPGGKHGKISLAEIFWEALCAHVEETESGSFVWVAYNINQLQTLQQVNADLMRACCVCIPDLRVKYLDKGGKPVAGTPSASAVLGFAWGEKVSGAAVGYCERFEIAFSPIGAVYQP